MTETRTPKVNIGWKAKDFKLLGIDDKLHTLEDVRGENGLVVMFICNHCPYVRAIMDDLIVQIEELKKYGIGAIGIMSNNYHNYPQDSFENMKRLHEKKGLSFPYVIDETQEVAKAYGAVCTPDFFGFNKDLELQYRGRFDASERFIVPNSHRDLFNAMVEIAETGTTTKPQYSSVGCSIKWK